MPTEKLNELRGLIDAYERTLAEANEIAAQIAVASQALASTGTEEATPKIDRYIVRSHSDPHTYYDITHNPKTGETTCTCPAFTYRGGKCKHVFDRFAWQAVA